YDFLTKQVRAFSSEHKNTIIYHACFPSDDRFVIASTSDRIATKWNAKTGDQIGQVAEHDDSVVAATYLERENRLITTGMDSFIKVWSSLASRDGRRNYSLLLPHRAIHLYPLDDSTFLSESEASTAILWKNNDESSLIERVPFLRLPDKKR